MIAKIQRRYEAEITDSCNLSCGSNINFLNIKSGEVILDLGCGRGKETILAAELSGSEGMAVGLDITPAMVKTAQANALAAGAENTEFLYGDIEQLPFDDSMFDAVMSNCVINHAQDKNKVYEEIRRVLKKGGRFVISDAVTKMPLPPEIKNDEEAWAQCFGGAITEKEYYDNIIGAGFDKIEILKRREYIKNDYDFISLTITAYK